MNGENKRIREITERTIAYLSDVRPEFAETAPIGIVDFVKWEWPQGVALFTLWRYYRLTGDGAVLKRIVDWFDDRFREGLPEKNVNTMCPLLAMTYLYEETRDEKYLPYLHEWADYALNKLPRTEEDGIQHIVTGVENRQQLWDDTLYMTVLFLARYGRLFHKSEFVEESKYQFLLHIKYLTDRKTGLWYHGWSFLRGDHFAGALWARGNSWFTAAVPDYLEMCELSPAERRFILTAFRRQAAALVGCQDASGLWHTLLDDPGSYTEASATANFAYGLLKGVRTGLLDEAYAAPAEKAAEALIGCVDANGAVRQVSYGTGMGDTLDFYKEIAICPMPYGQTLTALALMEYETYLAARGSGKGRS